MCRCFWWFTFATLQILEQRNETKSLQNLTETWAGAEISR